MSRNPTRRAHNFQDLTGQRFGLLTAFQIAVGDSQGHIRWNCRCDCGNLVDRAGTDLKQGKVKSCGCATKQLLSASLQIAAAERATELNAQRIDKITGTVIMQNGMVALVDPADVPLIESRVWQAQKSHENYYARASSGRERVAVLMHVLLMGKRAGVRVDHANGNGLDNRRENLRWATRSQNAVHVTRPPRGRSRYRGVHGGWWATVSKDGRRIRLGPFDNPEEAARAYDKLAYEMHGEFASLNFPVTDGG